MAFGTGKPSYSQEGVIEPLKGQGSSLVALVGRSLHEDHPTNDQRNHSPGGEVKRRGFRGLQFVKLHGLLLLRLMGSAAGVYY